MLALVVWSLLCVSPLPCTCGYQHHYNIPQQRHRRETPFYSFQPPGLYGPAHHYDPANTNAYHGVTPQQTTAVYGVPPPYAYVYSNLNGYVQSPHVGQDGNDVNYQGIHNTASPVAPGIVPTSGNTPVYYADCPCNKYALVERTRQIVCVCPQLSQLPIMKCPKQNACIPKHACNDDDEINIIDFLILGIYNAIEAAYCNDITHTCCRLTYPAAPAPNENEKNSIDNNISNSSINTLSNTITRYTIHGNTVKILNNGNPVVPAVEEDNKVENKTVIYDIDPRDIRRAPVKLAISPTFNENNNMHSIRLSASRSLAKTNEDSLVDGPNNVINNTIITSKINFNEPSELKLLNSQQSAETLNNTTETNENDQPSNFDANMIVILSSTTLSAQATRSPDDTSPSEVSNSTPILPHAQPTTTMAPTTSMAQSTVSETRITPSPERVTDVLGKIELEKIFGTPDKPITSQPSFTQNLIKIEMASLSSPSAVPASTIAPIPAGLVKNPTGRLAQLRNSSRTNATIGAILRSVKNKLENVNHPIVMSRINVESLHELFAHGNPTIVIIQDATNFGSGGDVDVNDGNDKKSRQTYDLSTGNEKVEVRNTSGSGGRCSADMKCVQKTYCTPEGEVSNVHIAHKEGMHLLECMNEESGLSGVCCHIPK